MTQIQAVSKTEIQRSLQDIEPLLCESAWMDGLPYIPLLPSLKAYALQQTSYEALLTEYSSAIHRAINDGTGYAYIG